MSSTERQRAPSADTASYGKLKDGDELEPTELSPEAAAHRNRMLGLSFLAMVVVGLMNKVFQKLQTIPMHNYPNYLNLLTTFMYIPLSFAYVIPATRAGIITEEQLAIPKKAFVVMGFLDCLAGIMQTFAATYLPGNLLVLMVQAAIPTSMFLSAIILRARYHTSQYVAATVVILGIVVVLVPPMFVEEDDDNNGTEQLIWSIVLIFSCVPMTLSSVYKEIALGETELDPVYLNAWIAVFQFLFSIPLAVPAALASSPPVYPDELPDNLLGGLKCYFGVSTFTCSDDGKDDDCQPDDCNPTAPIFVNVYLIFNVMYNILIIMILKWGSSNLLWLALTVMVPLGNFAFALPFMPETVPITVWDVLGLIVILAGLIGYRMGPSVWDPFCIKLGCQKADDERPSINDDAVQNALLRTSSSDLAEPQNKQPLLPQPQPASSEY